MLSYALLNIIFVDLLIISTLTIILGFTTRPMSEEILAGIPVKLYYGFLCGFASVMMMHYSWTFKYNGSKISLCVLTLIIAQLLGGIIASVIPLCSILLYYFFLWNDVYKNSIGIFFCLFIIAYLLLFLIDFFEKRHPFSMQIKWNYYMVVGIAVNFVYLRLVLEGMGAEISSLYFILFLVFWIIGKIEYKLMGYIYDVNMVYKTMQKEANTDFLTKLYNTRYITTILEKKSLNAAEKKSTLSCMMLDLDHFKKINDTYGHQTGDIVLQEIASSLEVSIRSRDVVGRVGGEEFCILLECSLSNAYEVAEKIRKNIESQAIKTDKGNLNVTLSIGIANYPETTLEYKNIKQLADSALYDAKKSGRNRVCICQK